MDVTSEESVNAAKQSVEKFFDENNIKGLWALINNAGVCIFGEFDWLTINQCERQVKVNLFGTILVTKKFLDSLIKTKGRVINIGSVNGISAYPGVAVYSATKFGVNGFSDALRYELKKLGVKVIMINPGDFARVTKIMDQHKANAEQMWSNMDLRKHKMYDDYFKEYQNKVLANCGLTSPSRIEDTSFLKDIEEAVYGVNPRNNIISATLPCRYFFLFLSILTTNGKHIVLDLLLKYVLRFDAKKYF
ncbi:D-beta-hydroxybutyrate dehydrogenase-like protein [Dinothrombium tinctorium]|uniref:D-beta-hydroxybutyrate dehydrogenase-like protein n=1 Tax=Dinothrombium tinctorium TaxID=1965070 RepID=A0A443R2H0_9ACAR|nr:D-beta-hydroxybutyrate dehydrogenase-like protein [Dinothrombium tinctorium]